MARGATARSDAPWRRASVRAAARSKPHGITSRTSGHRPARSAHSTANDGRPATPQSSVPPARAIISGTQWPGTNGGAGPPPGERESGGGGKRGALRARGGAGGRGGGGGGGGAEAEGHKEKTRGPGAGGPPPRGGNRRPPRHSAEQRPARQGDHLRYPVARHERRVEPLER